MPIFSPDIFDSVGDAIVTGGGTGGSTFVALNDTPANYTGSALKLVAVNSTPDALEFIDNLFYRFCGYDNNLTAGFLMSYDFASISQTYLPNNTFIIPQKCQVVSVVIVTESAGGNTQVDVLNPLKSDLGNTSSGATPLESVTLASTIGGTSYTANFGALSTFDAGDLFALNVNPTTAPDRTIVTITFKLVV